MVVIGRVLGLVLFLFVFRLCLYDLLVRYRLWCFYFRGFRFFSGRVRVVGGKGSELGIVILCYNDDFKVKVWYLVFFKMGIL